MSIIIIIIDDTVSPSFFFFLNCVRLGNNTESSLSTLQRLTGLILFTFQGVHRLGLVTKHAKYGNRTGKDKCCMECGIPLDLLLRNGSAFEVGTSVILLIFL